LGVFYSRSTLRMVEEASDREMTPVVEERAGGVLLVPERWGLPSDGTRDAARRLRRVWNLFRPCLRTRTRDASRHALVYLRGVLTMDAKRNYANIARRVNGVDDDGQNLQHFMSDSPWRARAVFDKVQALAALRPELRGGVLTLDETGKKRSGTKSAGAARQYLGRHGKVEVCQVGVMLGYYKKDCWLLVDAELYLPETWFDEGHADLRRRWHIPPERAFKSKVEIGLEMVLRAKENGLPFAVLCCDTLYGRSAWFRRALDAEGITYLAKVPSNTLVYLEKPEVGVPEKTGRGRKPERPRVLNGVEPVRVRELAENPNLEWREVTVRQAERGPLSHPCAALRVWTVDESGAAEEWLLIRREEDGDCSYSLSNAPEDTPLETLALWRSARYFAERTFQDAKTELGWDEFVALKYRAWMHHTAIDAIALWFVAETKLDWAKRHPPDPGLRRQLGVEELPTVSVANVREMLKEALPLKRLSQREAMRLVLKHLYGRARATRSRLKKRRGKGPPREPAR